MPDAIEQLSKARGHLYDARRLGYSSERTLELMRERGFGIEADELAVPR